MMLLKDRPRLYAIGMEDHIAQVYSVRVTLEPKRNRRDYYITTEDSPWFGCKGRRYIDDINYGYSTDLIALVKRRIENVLRELNLSLAVMEVNYKIAKSLQDIIKP